MLVRQTSAVVASFHLVFRCDENRGMTEASIWCARRVEVILTVRALQ